MTPTKVISHIVCSLALVTSIIVGFYGMNEYGVAPPDDDMEIVSF